MKNTATNRPRLFRRLRTWVLRLFAVYTREFTLVLHDTGLLLFFIFLPFAYPVIYSLIYNPEVVREVPMIVVDNDRTPLSRKMVREINACEQAWVRGYSPNITEAREAMNRGECYAILEIPEGFERKIGRGETGNAAMYCEMSLLLRYKALLVATTNIMEEMGGELLTETIDRVGPLAATITDGNLMPIENASLGNIKGGFDSFILPIVIILILQQCLILVTGMAGGAKHESIKLLHYNPDNITRSTLGTMIGQALCYITIMFLPTVFMYHYVPLIFRFPMAGNMIEEMALLLPMALGAIGVGFVFQAVVTERESVFVSWVVTSVMFLMLSGAIWPRCDMPYFWKALSDLCPATWGVEAFIKMNGNGAALWQVRTEYVNSWIVAAGWWAVGWACQRWVVHPEIRRHQQMRLQAARQYNETHALQTSTDETEGQN